MRVLELLRRERRRIRSYLLLQEFLRLLVLICIAWIGSFCAQRVLLAFRHLSLYASAGFWILFVTLALIVVWSFVRRHRIWSHIQLAQVAEEIEKQNPILRNAKERSELRIAGSFLEEDSLEGSQDFRQAHIESVDKRLSSWAYFVAPSKMLAALVVVAGFTVLVISKFPGLNQIGLPKTGMVWMPKTHEVQLPYPGAAWESRSGSVSVTKGSKVRFESPHTFLQPYVFVQVDGHWRVERCESTCEFQVTDSGQYSVGTLIARSAAFPIQSFIDEPPRSAVWVHINGDLVPGASLQLLNIKDLKLELTASDDLRLTKLLLVHRYGETEEILATIPAEEKSYRGPFTLKMDGWKGGLHLVFLEPHDDFHSSRSEPLQITYNDEKTLREKRLRDLEALINEWTHVLADLIESRLDRKLSQSLSNRLKEIQYPEMNADGLLPAYIKELRALSDRINGWIDSRAPMSRVDDLIKRTERSILYGLSLLFQERAGDIGQTAADLKSSQADLAKLLEQIKSGKLNMDSEALEQAFKELAKQLEDLQKKIAELPKGPQDQMINREALEAQSQEAQSLADRIEEIRKQAQSGDSKGALRELESLLNQLSILSREMERGLEQWQENLDQGALQKSQEFAKKIDEIKKQQEKLIQDLKKTSEDFDKSLEGTEWSQLFRSEEMKDLETQAGERMMRSKEGLSTQRMSESLTSQQEAVELLNKISQGQQQMQQKVQESAESASSPSAPEKMEILGSEGKGEKERKRKIMESLKQNVGEKYQKSHERYFEELLQR